MYRHVIQNIVWKQEVEVASPSLDEEEEEEKTELRSPQDIPDLPPVGTEIQQSSSKDPPVGQPPLDSAEITPAEQSTQQPKPDVSESALMQRVRKRLAASEADIEMINEDEEIGTDNQATAEDQPSPAVGSENEQSQVVLHSSSLKQEVPTPEDSESHV